MHEVSGLGTFRSFINYLVHLRTNKNMKCDRFTINFEEVVDNAVNPNVSISTSTRVRDSTRSRTHTIYQGESDVSFRKSLGSIKLFSLKLARSDEWSLSDFTLTKEDLRTRYKVARQQPPSRIASLNNTDLLSFLKENSSYRQYTNYI